MTTSPGEEGGCHVRHGRRRRPGAAIARWRGVGHRPPAWSPDSTQIAFVANDDSAGERDECCGTWTVDVVSGALTRVPAAGGAPEMVTAGAHAIGAWAAADDGATRAYSASTPTSLGDVYGQRRDRASQPARPTGRADERGARGAAPPARRGCCCLVPPPSGKPPVETG